MQKFGFRLVPRLGGAVIEAKGLMKSYGDRILFEDLNFTLPAGGIVGIIGPNGVGKTTLFRLITGQEKPDRGTISVGDTVKLALVDQTRDALPSDKPLWEAISDGQEMVHLGKILVPARAYAATIWFYWRCPAAKSRFNVWWRTKSHSPSAIN
jgi:ATPase subunit of ABC transporter with duplicated ATPase domains